MQPSRLFQPLPIVVALATVFPLPANANFTVASDATVTSGQSLTAGGSGTVAAGGTLTTSGSTVAVTIGSGTITLDNAGTISQTGTKYAIDDNAASTVLTLTNEVGGVITATGSEVIRIGKASDSFIINNQGTIAQVGVSVEGSRAIKADSDYTTTGNQIINGSATNRAAVISSTGNDALRLGSNVTLTNYGSIYSTGAVNTSCPSYITCTNDYSAADGVAIEDGRSNVVILNYGSITGPRHGIDGGDPVAASADSDLIGVDQLTVTSISSSGVTFDKVVNGVTTSGVTISNPVIINYAGGTITGNNGSGVGLDGHGVVINYGTITGQYAGAGNVYDHEGLGVTTSNGDGDGVDIDGVAYVENWGTIQGLGAGGVDSQGNPNGAEGIAAGGGTIINHAGATIYGEANAILIDDGANGTAIAAGRGTTTATGAAAIIYNSGAITAGKKTAIGLVGDFADTLVNYATGVITGGSESVRVDQLNSTTAGAAVQMGAGDDTLTNYGRIEGKNGLAIDMGDGDDTLRLFGGTVVGTIDGGSGSNTLETSGTQTFASGKLTNFQNYIVRGGTTTFDYALGSTTSLQIDSGAALRIEGGVATSGDLTVNGSFLAPSAGTLRTITVGGNYYQGAGGVLEVGVSGSNSDRIVTSGSATLVDGATIRPVAQGYVSNGSSYTIVTAASLSATVANLQVADSATVDYSLTTVGNELVLTASRSATLAALTGGGYGSLGAVLDTLGNASNTQTASLLGAIDSLSSGSEVSNALRQLAPDNSGAGSDAARLVNSGYLNTFANRIDSARQGGGQFGMAAGDNPDRRIWVDGFAATADQDARAGASGYQLNAGGLAVGFESNRSARELLGVSIGYTQANANGKDSADGDDVHVSGYHVGAYASRVDSDLTLDGEIVAGYNDYRSRRTVAFSGYSEIVHGDYSGWSLAARGEAGFPFVLTPTWQGRWLAGARLGYLTTDRYTEQGSSAVAQRVDASDAWSVQSVFGAELTHPLSDRAALTMRARYLHEFADSPDISASFVAGGSGFTVAGAKENRDALQLGVGMRRVTSSGVVLTFAYDAEVRERYLAQQLSAHAVWPF